MWSEGAGHHLSDRRTVRAQHRVVAVLGHIQHAQSARRGADGQFATVQSDADVGHHSLVLSFQQEVGEVQWPKAQLVIFGTGHRVAEDITLEL